MRKHTPGEWFLDDRTYQNSPAKMLDIRADVDGQKHIVAVVDICGSRITKEERIANAHLIAAAPELLASLVECYALLSTIDCKIPDEQYGVITRAADAIAKAEGK